MELDPDRGFVAAHAQYIATRTRSETDHLAGLILRTAWRGGHDDRYDPVAVEWLRRWTPEAVPFAHTGCSCFEGRCTVCN